MCEKYREVSVSEHWSSEWQSQQCYGNRGSRITHMHDLTGEPVLVTGVHLLQVCTANVSRYLTTELGN